MRGSQNADRRRRLRRNRRDVRRLARARSSAIPRREWEDELVARLETGRASARARLRAWDAPETQTARAALRSDRRRHLAAPGRAGARGDPGGRVPLRRLHRARAAGRLARRRLSRSTPSTTFRATCSLRCLRAHPRLARAGRLAHGRPSARRTTRAGRASGSEPRRSSRASRRRSTRDSSARPGSGSSETKSSTSRSPRVRRASNGYSLRHDHDPRHRVRRARSGPAAARPARERRARGAPRRRGHGRARDRPPPVRLVPPRPAGRGPDLPRCAARARGAGRRRRRRCPSRRTTCATSLRGAASSRCP